MHVLHGGRPPPARDAATDLVASRKPARDCSILDAIPEGEARDPSIGPPQPTPDRSTVEREGIPQAPGVRPIEPDSFDQPPR
jgi:hypothetical protein